MYKRGIYVSAAAEKNPNVIMKFVQKADKFDCNIWLEKENRKVSGKSLLGVISLELTGGNEIIIRADGTDEKEAVDFLTGLLAEES